MSIRVPRLHATRARISINPTKVLCFKPSLAFALAAVTKYHGCSGGLQTPELYSSPFWGLGRARAGCQQDRFPGPWVNSLRPLPQGPHLRDHLILSPLITLLVMNFLCFCLPDKCTLFSLKKKSGLYAVLSPVSSLENIFTGYSEGEQFYFSRTPQHIKILVPLFSGLYCLKLFPPYM